ncbi:MAG: YfcE family phosphodiesterase [Ruminococcaceae bacterium]|nr:YfcE family phosphodiesterase [Oscillospiraceae bacterium]
MNVLVLSDSHGRRDRLSLALERTGAHTVLFLGDGLRDLDEVDERVTVYAVRGNCDWYSAWDAPDRRVEILGGYRLFLCHGHTYGVKSGLDRAILAAHEANADVLLYGHTHIPFERTLAAGTVLSPDRVLQKPLLVVCPGSIGHPPCGSFPSFATLELRPEGVLAGFGKLTAHSDRP